MSKYIRRISLYTVGCIVVTFLIVWTASMIKCEVLTNKYYDEFEYAYQNNTMIDDVEYFKVLNCNGATAEVYYVSASNGDVLVFELKDGTWIETEWRSIWAKNGSASDIVWPYWWQFFITGL